LDPRDDSKRDALTVIVIASAAKQSRVPDSDWIASSQVLLAMTAKQERLYETALRLHHGEPAQRDALHRSYGKLAQTCLYEAIAREKQIKAGSRAKKLALIEGLNPEWKDLYETLI
jgi:hypothetical protein